jgi:multidrug efflux pump subunit AcrA (membrane-fusion protein)
MKNKSLIGFTILILASVVFGSVVYFRINNSYAEVSPKVGPVIESVYGLGTVISDKIFPVKTGIINYVRQLYVKEGDTVVAGQNLIKFEDGPIVKAPFAGTITKISYQEGELVAMQTPVIVLTNLTLLSLEMSLEQQTILRVKKGQSAIVSFESLRNERFEGKVTSIYPRDNQFIVRLELNKNPEGVLPGMTADVALEVGRKENALLIPIKGINGGKVVRVRNSKVEKIPVKLGVVDGEWGEILDGSIEPSDKIQVRAN